MITRRGESIEMKFFSFLNQDAGYQLPLCLVDPISVSTIALILLMPFARRDIFYNSVFPILVTIEN